MVGGIIAFIYLFVCKLIFGREFSWLIPNVLNFLFWWYIIFSVFPVAILISVVFLTDDGNDLSFYYRLYFLMQEYLYQVILLGFISFGYIYGISQFKNSFPVANLAGIWSCALAYLAEGILIFKFLKGKK